MKRLECISQNNDDSYPWSKHSLIWSSVIAIREWGLTHAQNTISYFIHTLHSSDGSARSRTERTNPKIKSVAAYAVEIKQAPKSQPSRGMAHDPHSGSLPRSWASLWSTVCAHVSTASSESKPGQRSWRYSVSVNSLQIAHSISIGKPSPRNRNFVKIGLRFSAWMIHSCILPSRIHNLLISGDMKVSQKKLHGEATSGIMKSKLFGYRPDEIFTTSFLENDTWNLACWSDRSNVIQLRTFWHTIMVINLNHWWSFGHFFQCLKRNYSITKTVLLPQFLRFVN
jgi:hypothetical protein